MAQKQSAIVKGFVSSNTGESLPGITVMLEKTTRGAATDFNGRFEIKNIAPGDYSLTISGIGYKRKFHTITLSAGQTLKLDIQLEEDAQQLAEVVVRAETEAVRLERTAEAVSAIDTRKVKLLTADLGEVMARTQGVSCSKIGRVRFGHTFLVKWPH